MILAAVVKWVAGRRVDNYNLQAAYPISYAVGYEVSYKNHYYLIPDLMKIADSKMYQDKAYKKKNQKKLSGNVIGTKPGSFLRVCRRQRDQNMSRISIFRRQDADHRLQDG